MHEAPCAKGLRDSKSHKQGLPTRRNFPNIITITSKVTVPFFTRLKPYRIVPCPKGLGENLIKHGDDCRLIKSTMTQDLADGFF